MENFIEGNMSRATEVLINTIEYEMINQPNSKMVNSIEQFRNDKITLVDLVYIAQDQFPLNANVNVAVKKIKLGAV